MDADLQAAIAASLADQGSANHERQDESEDVILVDEDVFSVELTDTDGDTIVFMLLDDAVQQYVNGKLEISRVAEIALDESTGQVMDATGRFTVPEYLRSRLKSLRSLFTKAGVQIKSFESWQAAHAMSSLSSTHAMNSSSSLPGGDCDEAQMEAALAASIAESQQQNRNLRLDSEREQITGGVVLRQHNTLNQFHPHFSAAIKRHQAPASICGYMTIANCRLLRQYLEGAPSPLPASILREAVRKLVTEKEVVTHETERAMHSIAAKRRRYMEAHANAFASAAERRKYLRAWVANFEISDELNEEPFPDGFRPSQPAPSLHFARYNEFPQLSVATHEERERILAEQRRFGGHLNAKGESVFGAGDSAHILERFVDGATSQLLAPGEWQQAEGAGGGPRVFAVDLNGHFAAAVVAPVKEDDGRELRVLQVLNTTDSFYLNWPMLADVHRFVFRGAGRTT